MARLNIEISDEKKKLFHKKALLNNTNMSKVVETDIDRYLSTGDDEIALATREEALKKQRDVIDETVKSLMGSKDLLIEGLETTESVLKFQANIKRIMTACEQILKASDAKYYELKDIERFGKTREQMRKENRQGLMKKPVQSSSIYQKRRFEEAIGSVVEEDTEIKEEDEQIITE